MQWGPISAHLTPNHFTNFLVYGTGHVKATFAANGHCSQTLTALHALRLVTAVPPSCQIFRVLETGRGRHTVKSRSSVLYY